MLNQSKDRRKILTFVCKFYQVLQILNEFPSGIWFGPILPDLSNWIVLLSLRKPDQLIYSLFDILANITV